jgi:hypothetical protein
LRIAVLPQSSPPHSHRIHNWSAYCQQAHAELTGDETMMMRDRPIVPLLTALFLIALVIGGGVLAYNAGAGGGSFLGLAVSPVVGGLLAVLLLLFVIRIATHLLLMPLFGFGIMHRRRWFGPRWSRGGWRHGWGRMHGPGEWEGGVPPMVAEWHRKLHEAEAKGEAGDETTGT